MTTPLDYDSWLMSGPGGPCDDCGVMVDEDDAPFVAETDETPEDKAQAVLDALRDRGHAVSYMGSDRFMEMARDIAQGIHQGVHARDIIDSIEQDFFPPW